MVVRDLGNLPREVSSFVGRRSELADAARLLGSSRLLTLTGPGGVGKTRLARRVAHDARRAYPDGVWFVELAGLVEGDLVAAAIGSVLGRFHAATAPDLDLAEHLQERQLLLVLDNCEHLVQETASLLDEVLTTAPGIRVIATSRELLGVEGETVLPVPPLSTPAADRPVAAESDAVALFAERAAVALPGFAVDESNRDLVVDICRRLEGVPLALELAAARLRAYSLEEVIARLDDALHTLASSLRTAPERHRTLESTVAWSYRLCSPEEQVLWSRLSVFADGFTLDAAEVVCSGGPVLRSQVFDLIAGLVDKSIITREGAADGRAARLQMLGLLRDFGAARLAEDGQEEAAVRLRHRDYFRDLALRGRTDYFTPRELEWSRRVREEHSNIRAAVHHCQTALRDQSAVLEIAAPLQLYRVGASFVVEEHRWLSSALDLDDRQDEVRARALTACSYAATLTGDGTEGERRAIEAAKLATSLDLPEVAADAACSLARASFYCGDSARTLELSERAVRQCLESGNTAGACDALYRAAITAVTMRDPRAAQYSAASLALATEHGSPYRTASGLWADGLRHWRAGDQELAVARLREALPLYVTLGFPAGVAMCYEGLALAAAALGDDVRSAILRGAADTVWRTTAAPFPQAVVRSLGADEVAEASRVALGESGYRAAFEQGAALTTTAAIGYALDNGGASPAALTPAAQPSPLTPRETEVADLVAAGLSNREIAEKLVVAQRTAEGHVERILTKFGFRSRTQVAAWVAERRREDR